MPALRQHRAIPRVPAIAPLAVAVKAESVPPGKSTRRIQ